MKLTAKAKQLRMLARDMEPGLAALLGRHVSRREIARGARAAARNAVQGPVALKLGPGGDFVTEWPARGRRSIR